MICDLAETYNIYDYRRVPVSLLGTLVAGLGDNARIRKEINKVRGNTDTILLARILDAVNLLLWLHTKDAEKGKNRPEEIASEFLYKEESKEKPKAMSIEAYEKFRQSFFEDKDDAEEGK